MSAPITFISDDRPKRRRRVHPVLRGLTIGVILSFSLFYFSIWFAANVFQPWFTERWQPIKKFVPGEVAMLPVDSNLSKLITIWLQANAKKPVTPAFADMVIKETFDSAYKNNVDPFLMLAIMKVESEFDYTAQSGAGAVGLTQVIPQFHLKRNGGSPHMFDPKTNIRIGTEVLAEYSAAYKGDLQKALKQYNGSLKIPGNAYSGKVLTIRASLIAYLERMYVLS